MSWGKSSLTITIVRCMVSFYEHVPSLGYCRHRFSPEALGFEPDLFLQVDQIDMIDNGHRDCPSVRADCTSKKFMTAPRSADPLDKVPARNIPEPESFFLFQICLA